MHDKLTIDFETRSRVYLPACGVWPYAEHDSTSVMCLSLKRNDKPSVLWIPNYYLRIINPYVDWEKFPVVVGAERAIEMIEAADIIEAHNAMFERAIYYHKMHLDLDWPAIPDRKWRCSAAKASAMALPRSLGGACDALALPVQKDMDGRRIMLKLCKPRKPTKHNPSIWHEGASDLISLYRYCARDTDAEYALSEALPDLSPKELEIWRLDQVINMRGIPVDRNFARVALEVIADRERVLLAELILLTGGVVDSPKQVEVLRVWCNERHGGLLMDLTKATVAAALERDDLDPLVRRALEIRQSLSRSSTAKYETFVNAACADGRIRDTKLYHGASTGRWAGRLIQPDNMPRGEFQDTDQCVSLFSDRFFKAVDMLYGGRMRALSTCIRATIKAEPGDDFICADFSSIEGRVLAWLAGEEHILDAYRAGLDLYKVSASLILGIPYDEITKDQRSRPGKVAELACLAGDTLVLTDSGIKPLEEVGYFDSVHDGVKFVRHEGLKCVGHREVIDLYGVDVTPDHEIYMGNNEWKIAGDLRGNTVYHMKATYMANSQLSVALGIENLPAVLWELASRKLLRNKKTAEGRTVPVYDLLNCGPRNRFTIITRMGPLLVHNCGYQGGPGACRAFGASGTDQELRESIVTPWRENRPATVYLWRAMEDCAIAAVREPGKTFRYRYIGWAMREKFLHARLPSGRLLAYYDPQLSWAVLIGTEDLIYKAHDLPSEEAAEEKRDEWIKIIEKEKGEGAVKWSFVKEALAYMGMRQVHGKTTTKWTRVPTYGGKLTENVTQAVARDVLAEAMWRVERSGYPVVFHVHDEIIAEVDKGFGGVEEFCGVMCQVPTWGVGLPIDADGWRGERYRK